MSLRLGRVADVHPEDHSVDLVMIDDGSRLAGVQVQTQSGSSNTGMFDLPTPAKPGSGNKWSLTEGTDRDMIAVVGFISGQPVVTGFLFPQVSQMLFKDPNMRVMRHASDVYTALDGLGNFEMAFPNGAYIRVGSSPAHQDLSDQNVDKSWNTSKNTDAELHIHVEQAGGKATVDIDPAGNIKVTTMEKVDIEAQKDVTLKTPTKIVLDAPETVVKGLLTIEDGMSLSGGSGDTATISGNVQVTGSISASGSISDGDGDGGA